jgi:hypothetical protein
MALSSGSTAEKSHSCGFALAHAVALTTEAEERPLEDCISFLGFIKRFGGYRMKRRVKQRSERKLIKGK